jgi:two-component system OmpR family sensor kinase
VRSLTVQIYLFGLVVLLTTGLVHLASLARLHTAHRQHLQLLSAQMAERLWADPQDLESVDADVTVYDLQGKLVASTVTPPLPLPEAGAHEIREGGQVVGVGVVELRHSVTTLWNVTQPVLGTLLVLLLVAWLFARRLVRPLQRLVDVARAFGTGDLRVRVGGLGHDEIGEVGRAFDAMADRVADLMVAQQELMANVSHELRTPLARLQVAVDLLADGKADSAEEVLPDMAQDLAETLRLLDDVMTVARLDLSRADRAALVPLRRELLSAEALVEQAVCRFRAQHPGRVLAVELAPGLPALWADPVLLRRVLDNLLENARKYSEPDTTLRLSAHPEAGGVQLLVSDEGIGIDEQDLPRVFVPFFHSDRSRTRATGGAGLGLALSRRVVEAHGGNIALASRPGQGTTVTVWLPANIDGSLRGSAAIA